MRVIKGFAVLVSALVFVGTGVAACDDRSQDPITPPDYASCLHAPEGCR